MNTETVITTLVSFHHTITALTMNHAHDEKIHTMIERARFLSTVPKDVIASAWLMLESERMNDHTPYTDKKHVRHKIADLLYGWVRIEQRHYHISLREVVEGQRIWWSAIPLKVANVVETYTIPPSDDEEDRDILGMDRPRIGMVCLVILDLEPR